MKTNRYLQLSLFIGCIALMASCSDPVKSRLGGYSYQIAKQEVTIDDTLSIVLTGEMGSLQMEQVKDDNILLTFNSLKGDVYTTTGRIDDRQCRDARRNHPFYTPIQRHRRQQRQTTGRRGHTDGSKTQLTICKCVNS